MKLLKNFAQGGALSSVRKRREAKSVPLRYANSLDNNWFSVQETVGTSALLALMKRHWTQLYFFARISLVSIS